MQGESRRPNLLEGFCRAAAYLREAKIVQGEWNERIKPTIFWKRVFYSWTRVARNERIEWIGRNASDVRDERNVRNKRDEQIWRNTVFVFRAKRLTPPSSRAYRIPDWHFHLLFRPLAKTERKSAKKSGANAPLQNGLTVFKERQTIRVSLKANAYCSVLPVSERVRGLSSLT